MSRRDRILARSDIPMRILKNGESISCVDDWRRLAPPKSVDQWVRGRSAFELANAWCGTGTPAIPGVLRELFDSRPETRSLIIETVHPEHRIPFDDHGGEPRNADLAFVGQTADRKIAVTVEAKADESFGTTVAKTISDALERSIRNPRSHGIRRVEDLVRSLMPAREKGDPHVGDLRYQLLTAAAGSLAYAAKEGADSAVLVVHEFVTDLTRDVLHSKNAAAFRAFVHRLSRAEVIPEERELLGPFGVPGGPLFQPAVPLFIGKIVTRCRELRA
jgi:hypothetical protein